MIRTPGNARPELVGGALAARRGHAHARRRALAGTPRPCAARPHHAHSGTAPCRAACSGPPQCGQRAGCRHSAHTSTGAYPGRATCTSTGPSASASRAAANAADGTRAPRDSPSRVALSTTRGLSAARGRDIAHPAHRDEPLDVGRAGVAREDERAAVELLPEQCGVAGVHAGAERLGEQRIAVVPDRDQPERRAPARRRRSGCR